MQALIARLQMHPAERAAAGFRRIELLDDLGRRKEAVAASVRLLDEFAGKPEAGVVVPCCQTLRLLAHMLRQLHRPVDALATLDRLIAAHGQRPEPEIREHIAHALYQRTWWIDDPAARCEACDAMSELLDSQPDAALDTWCVEARLLKAEIEHHRGLPQDALATLEAVIERFDGSTDPGVVLRVARARLASVLNLRELAQHAQAQVTCLSVADQIEAALAHAAPELRIEGVRALTLFFDGFGIDEHAKRAELVGWLLDRYGHDASPQVRRMAVRRAYDWSVGLRESEDGEAALAACDRLLATFGADTDAVVHRTVASALLNKGFVLLERLGRAEEALQVYQQLERQLQGASEPELQDTLAKATAGRQACLKRLRKADAQGSLPELATEVRDEVRDKVRQGRRHGDAGESHEAIALFDEVLAAHAASPHPELRRQCARALVHKAFCLVALERFEEVIAAADAMDARHGADPSTEMQETVALCLQYKSTALDRLGRHDDEMRVHDEIVARWGNSDLPDLRGRVAGALFRKGATLRHARRLEAAVACYDEAIARTSGAREGTLQLWAAKSMINKARALDKLGDAAGQIKAYRTLIARFGDSGDAALRERVVNACEWLAEAEGRQGRVEAQRAALEAALGRFGTALSTDQRTRLARELQALKARALGRKAKEVFGRVVRRRA
ncbi:tetratricopeptide repeat protein [uncultured Variovorax sp.]|uniref:tetratricopeptide repeat protein n=1 Tax=uncultured Variovorax sp. TaxID=114708 RepID=UPI0025CE5DFC|nr:tetratricopeptide repeat protein [uncultured Variovorax sp.]